MAPTLPPEADGADQEAAEAFARYWVETLNASADRLDGSALREVSTDECAACLGIADSMDSIRSQGGSSDGGEWTIKTLAAEPSIEGWAAGLRISSAPQKFKRAAGAELERSSGNTFGVILEVDRFENQWRAYNLQFID